MTGIRVVNRKNSIYTTVKMSTDSHIFIFVVVSGPEDRLGFILRVGGGGGGGGGNMPQCTWYRRTELYSRITVKGLCWKQRTGYV